MDTMGDKSAVFLYAWRVTQGEAYLPEPEYQFHWERKWRFDWAFPLSRVAVEVNGGVWTGGRHNRGAGYLGDLEKLNTAMAMGWRVLQFTPSQLEDDPIACCKLVRHAMYDYLERPRVAQVIKSDEVWLVIPEGAASSHVCATLKQAREMYSTDGKAYSSRPSWLPFTEGNWIFYRQR